MAPITPAMKHFLTADKFAVVGRVITDPGRWDFKVVKWYRDRSLDVTPVRYEQPGGEVNGLSIIGDPTTIPDLSKTSLSIIINPKIGLSMLQALFPSQSSGNEPHGVWFQPGADSPEIHEFVTKRGLEEKVVLGGRCILVDGDRAREAGKL